MKDTTKAKTTSDVDADMREIDRLLGTVPASATGVILAMLARIVYEQESRIRALQTQALGCHVPGCVRLIEEGPGHPGACRTTRKAKR